MAIKKELIKPGDILMFRITKKSSLLGKLIGFFSVLTGQGGSYGKTYGHVALVETPETFLEMTFPKSRRTKLDCNNFELELWRISKVTKEQIDTAIRWEVGNIGKWYNIRHIISLGLIKGRGCSDHLLTAYQQAGIILSKKGAEDPVCSPNEIMECGLVTCIDDGGHADPKEKR